MQPEFLTTATGTPPERIFTVLGRTASAGYSFQVEAKWLALRAGHAAIEVPIRFEQRRAGTSKMNLAVQAESVLLPWRLRFRGRPGELAGHRG